MWPKSPIYPYKLAKCVPLPPPSKSDLLMEKYAETSAVYMKVTISFYNAALSQILCSIAIATAATTANCSNRK